MTAEEILTLVNNYIDNLPYDREPKSLYEPVRSTLALGGKRIRPVLMHPAVCVWFGNVS